jgi:hypothetical protein
MPVTATPANVMEINTSARVNPPVIRQACVWRLGRTFM